MVLMGPTCCCRAITLFVFFFLLPTYQVHGGNQSNQSADEQLRRWLPDYLQFQVAGNLGLASIGTGYTFQEGRIQIGALYGYLPGFSGGTSVHTLAHKSAFHPIDISINPNLKLVPVYLGYTANLALGEQYHILIQDRHRDYYWPSALHLTLFAGSRAHIPLSRIDSSAPSELELYIEVGTLDVYLLEWMGGNGNLGVEEIMGLALGASLVF